MAGVKRPKRLRRSRRIKRSRKVRRRSRSRKVGGLTVAAWPEVPGGASGPGSEAVATMEVDPQGVFRPPPLSPLGMIISRLDEIETNQTEIFRRLDAIDSVTHFSTKGAEIQFIPSPPGNISDDDDFEARFAALTTPE